ncbi:MAG: hypothetical protein COT59_00895, partial [Candidatus Nealsonbacteria bacterium CG09_land_8_20_14_0_10_42_14]
FGLALPNLALANPFAGALAGVFATLFGLISNILGTITGAFLGMAVAIFNWVASPSFISLPYTQLSNPFIKIGWTLTRDLTNIFFVLGLVVIGLGTALRLTGYQAQKALPTLIIIALLINFTPVILGLIVDASNIVMNFFVQGGFAGGNSFANYATSQWGNIGSLVGGLKFWDPTANQEATAAAVGSFVLIFFNLIAGLIYLLFAFIFIIRYVAIWTLVILSPFAFACYILPATRKVFSQWWQQFLQWSFVGVIAAFFLYLGDHFIRKTTQEDFLASSMGEITNASGLAPLINSIMPYFVAIIFLFIGLIMSLSFAPKGADFIINRAKQGGKAAGKVAEFAAAKGAWEGVKGAGKSTSALPQSFAKGVKAGGGWTKPKGWATGFKSVGKTLTPPPPKQWLPLAKGYVKYRGGAAATGTWKAIKGAAVAGGAAALGIKLKKKGKAVLGKKGFQKCPTCGEEISAAAKVCTKCGEPLISE